MIRVTITVAPSGKADRDLLGLLTPVPQLVHQTGGTVSLPENASILVEGTPEPESSFPPVVGSYGGEYLLNPSWNMSEFGQRIAAWIGARARELGSTWELPAGNVSASEEPLHVDLGSRVPAKMTREGYQLDITGDGISIVAWTMRGAYYGVVTLCQAMGVEPPDPGTVILPRASIVDWPVFHVRGLVDDISRGQRPTVDNLKKFIRFLSRTKQNALVLYIEDIIHYKSHPRIGKNRGRLEIDEIWELQRYAKEWFVNIIPGIELLGHMENILLDPEYMSLGEFPGSQCIDVTNPEAREFIVSLIRDASEIFESPIFAPICDESMDFGQGKAAAHVKKLGYAKALAEWYLFLMDEIRKAGKPIVIFAHDIIIKFKEALKEVQKADAMIYCWIYANKDKYPAISKLTNMGLTVVGGPAVFDWSRHYPHYDYAEGNMIGMGKDSVARGSIGLITTKWGDFGNENFRDNIYYGLNVNAQAAWTPFKSDVPQVRRAFTWHFFGTLDGRVMACMDVLSKQNHVLPRFPNGMFNRYWMDPFVRDIKPAEHDMARRFIREAANVLETVNALRREGAVRLNEDNLDYIAFAARMARHYGTKILVAEAAYRGEESLAVIAKEHVGYDGDPVEGGLAWLHQDALDQLPVYKDLWTRIAVPQGLEYPTRHFEILAWHYEQALATMRDGERPGPRQLQSEWIWRPGRRTRASWGNKQWQRFAKAFTVSKPVVKATLQGIAANHARLHVNGNPTGEVLSRQSLGLLPLASSVHWFDVTSDVVQGENVLCIDAINWGNGIGAVNAILHVEHDDGTATEVITDGTWTWYAVEPPGWPFASTPVPNGDGMAKSHGKPPGAWQGPITEPAWDRGWKSSTSFVLGNRNFIETAIPIVLGRGAYSLLFWLFPLLVRALGTDMLGFREA